MPTPRYFYPVAILSLLWNLTGDAFYLMQVSADLTEIAKTDPYMAKAFATMPMWAWSAYAIAVWGGTLAAVMLMIRKSLAAALFALSLAGIIVQFSYGLGMTDLIAVKGPSAAIFPAILVILGVAQFWFARSMVIKGVLR